MSIGLFRFQWTVPENGYYWVDAYPDDGLPVEKSKKVPVLVEKPLGTVLRYDPIQRQESSLFKKFSRLPATPEAIMQFANRYGSLGGRVSSFYYIRSDDTLWSPEAKVITGEPLKAWKREIALMNEATKLWEGLKDKDCKKLYDCVCSIQERYFEEIGSPHKPSEASEFGMQDTFDYLLALCKEDMLSSFIERVATSEFDGFAGRENEFIEFTGYLLTQLINLQLKAMTAAQIKLNSQNQKLRFTPMLSPDSLLGALWVQFYEAVTENRRFVECADCGAPFEIRRDRDSRSSKKFCSNACRLRFHRKKNGKAED